MNNKEFLLTDTIEYVQGNLWKTEWIDIFSLENNDNLESKTFFSAFITQEHIEKSFETYSRDIHIGDGMPWYTTYREHWEQINEYNFYYTEKKYPLIFLRSYPWREDRVIEVLQEFCFYFDLYEDRDTRIYYQIDDNWDYIEVIKITNHKVSIKLKYIKIFCAVKNTVFMMYFEEMRFSTNNLKDMWISAKEETNWSLELGYLYNHYIADRNLWEWRTAQSWLIGKKLILPSTTYDPDIFHENRKYEDFIIWVDEDGEEITYTCNKNECWNGFWQNTNKPYYLTPICFKKEVLKKYYDNTSKYEVDDGVIHCKWFRYLKIDNNHDDYITVFLWDLWLLPHKEQQYWKSYNIIGNEKKISYTGYQRSFMGEFCDPEQPDLYFKMIFWEFQEQWHQKYRFYLFLPLYDQDTHYFKSLHTPLSNEIKEFEEQVLWLTKILIDSINEKEIRKYITIQDDEKWIKKLEKYLTYLWNSIPDLINFLKDLQSLRSTWVAHRKWWQYESIADKFDIWKKSNKEIFNNILIKAIWTINSLKIFI